MSRGFEAGQKKKKKNHWLKEGPCKCGKGPGFGHVHSNEHRQPLDVFPKNELAPLKQVYSLLLCCYMFGHQCCWRYEHAQLHL